MLLQDVGVGVSARAACPVMVIPTDPAPESLGAVVVGVKSSSHSAELLAAAFAAASIRGARVIVVHAWRFPGSYDESLTTRELVEDWVRHSAEETESLLKDWRTAYPEVEVEVRLLHIEAARALVSASAEADLLVIVVVVGG